MSEVFLYVAIGIITVGVLVYGEVRHRQPGERAVVPARVMVLVALPGLIAACRWLPAVRYVMLTYLVSGLTCMVAERAARLAHARRPKAPSFVLATKDKQEAA